MAGCATSTTRPVVETGPRSVAFTVRLLNATTLLVDATIQGDLDGKTYVLTPSRGHRFELTSGGATLPMTGEGPPQFAVAHRPGASFGVRYRVALPKRIDAKSGLLAFGDELWVQPAQRGRRALRARFSFLGFDQVPFQHSILREEVVLEDSQRIERLLFVAGPSERRYAVVDDVEYWVWAMPGARVDLDQVTQETGLLFWTALDYFAEIKPTQFVVVLTPERLEGVSGFARFQSAVVSVKAESHIEGQGITNTAAHEITHHWVSSDREEIGWYREGFTNVIAEVIGMRAEVHDEDAYFAALNYWLWIEHQGRSDARLKASREIALGVLLAHNFAVQFGHERLRLLARRVSTQPFALARLRRLVVETLGQEALAQLDEVHAGQAIEVRAPACAKATRKKYLHPDKSTKVHSALMSRDGPACRRWISSADDAIGGS